MSTFISKITLNVTIDFYKVTHYNNTGIYKRIIKNVSYLSRCDFRPKQIRQTIFEKLLVVEAITNPSSDATDSR